MFRYICHLEAQVCQYQGKTAIVELLTAFGMFGFVFNLTTVACEV